MISRRGNIVKKYLKFIPLYILIIIVLVFATALIRCEILTQKYYSDFEYAYKDNTMLGNIEYFKVLECDGKTARVYYVAEDMKGASVLTFKKDADIWTETKWEVIWSTSGSASDIVWPYIWHFIYGGF